MPKGRGTSTALDDGPGSESATFEGTAGILESAASDGPVRTLQSVRIARHTDFDRVVFDFKGGRPGYHVEYIDTPVRQCGSGDPTAMRGEGWLEIRMSPAAAHDDGRPTIADRERLLDLPVVREAELTCDYEGIVTWVLGVSSPNHYRVLELDEPPRLVVDVRHR